MKNRRTVIHTGGGQIRMTQIRNSSSARQAPNDATFAKLRSAGRTALIPYVTVGDTEYSLPEAEELGVELQRIARAAVSN